MGTNYTFTINASNPSVLIEVIRTSGILGDVFCGKLETTCERWTNHEEDMLLVSRQFPKVLFTLSIRGEDCLWRKYFLGGKMQSSPGRIEYEPFDSAKLT